MAAAALSAGRDLWEGDEPVRDVSAHLLGLAESRVHLPALAGRDHRLLGGLWQPVRLGAAPYQ